MSCSIAALFEHDINKGNYDVMISLAHRTGSDEAIGLVIILQLLKGHGSRMNQVNMYRTSAEVNGETKHKGTILRQIFSLT